MYIPNLKTLLQNVNNHLTIQNCHSPAVCTKTVSAQCSGVERSKMDDTVHIQPFAEHLSVSPKGVY